MMTRPGTCSGGFCLTGVVIDRNRPRLMISASSVPKDLIVQCQVFSIFHAFLRYF
ncbi:unnamed protein product [Meloidogyne enterolobii]|uniref:Uncharacterized protein n=1 Tax=Meloidogyne enterolobii TaxID=390850 RepID=A0ACB0ZGJ8_MELEN